ncbi:MAG: hypothetical protein EPO64_08595 [Nitrospirae bacterium]|nr:MAG: hypothetical protein EPO64_08595 [Nitrospirota bacterium]
MTKLLAGCAVVSLFLSSFVWAADAPSPFVIEPPPVPVATDVLVRVVAQGAMVLGDDVGGARVTITEVSTGRQLASGLQEGEAGDQNQIMRTPRLMEEPRYSSRPSGFFHTTLHLDRPTLVEITAQGPMDHPAAMQRASKTVLLIPGQDLTNDGIVLHLNGFIVQIEQPPPGTALIAKDDVTLKASVQTLSGSLVRPHSDWDSRKVKIYGEVVIGDRVVERIQMFYSGAKSHFEAPFFVPNQPDAPDGITLRVVAADGGGGNFGMGEAAYPVLTERLKPARKDVTR